MKNLFLPIALIGGAIFYFSRLKSTGENLKVNLSNVSIKSSKGLNLPKIILTFELINVTNTSINLNAIVGDVYVNGSFLATINNLDRVIIGAKSKTNLNVELQTSILDAGSIVKDLIFQKGKRSLNFTADIKLNVNGILLPIKINKTVL